VKTRIRNKHSWEIVDVDVQGSLKTKRSGQRGDNLSNEPIEVLVRRTINVKRPTAHVVESLIIKIESKIRVFKEGMCGKHSIIRLYHSCRNLWRWSDGETHLGFAAEVNSKTLKKKGTKTGSSSSSSGMEDEESLKG